MNGKIIWIFISISSNSSTNELFIPYSFTFVNILFVELPSISILNGILGPIPIKAGFPFITLNGTWKIIFLLSFAFDLYYDYSRGLLLDKGYYNRIFENIKDKDKFKPYFDEVEKYLRECENNAW